MQTALVGESCQAVKAEKREEPEITRPSCWWDWFVWISSTTVKSIHQKMRTFVQKTSVGLPGATLPILVRYSPCLAEGASTLVPLAKEWRQMSQLERYGVTHKSCVYHSDCKLPTSCVVLNVSSGSRTIVHYRNLPELKFEEFVKVDLSSFCWIHFEGRNPSEYSKMVEHIHKVTDDKGHSVTVSIEVEKTKPELVNLFPLADVLFVSKEFARFQGYSTMQEAVVGLRSKAKQGAVIVCAWGERGAAASDKDGQVYESAAYPPAGQVVDTLGAGDTFNAGIIHCLSQGRSVKEALSYACKLAGTKCGMVGFDGLKNYDPS